VIVLQLGKLDLASPAGKMMLTMLAAVAEMERDLLMERTQAGLVCAKSEGKTAGPPSKDDGCTAVGDRPAVPSRRKRQRAGEGVRHVAGKHLGNCYAITGSA